MRRPRRRGEEGFAGGLEGLVFGVLLFIVGTLIVAAAWGVVDTKEAVSEAAREAARSYVEAPNASAAADSAVQSADESLQGLGRDPSRARVTVEGASFARCQRVTVVVSYPAPLLELPFVGRVGSGATVSSDQSELVNPYSAGLAGSANCP